MKQVIAIVASVFALTAFAAEAPKATTPAPVAATPAKDIKASVPAKSEAKTAPSKEVKAAK